MDALLIDPLVFNLLFEEEGGVLEELVLGCCPLAPCCAAATGFPNSSRLMSWSSSSTHQSMSVSLAVHGAL